MLSVSRKCTCWQGVYKQTQCLIWSCLNGCAQCRHHRCTMSSNLKNNGLSVIRKTPACFYEARIRFASPTRSTDVPEMQSERYIKTICKIDTKTMKYAKFPKIVASVHLLSHWCPLCKSLHIAVELFVSLDLTWLGRPNQVSGHLRFVKIVQLLSEQIHQVKPMSDHESS